NRSRPQITDSEVNRKLWAKFNIGAGRNARTRIRSSVQSQHRTASRFGVVRGYRCSGNYDDGCSDRSFPRAHHTSNSFMGFPSAEGVRGAVFRERTARLIELCSCAMYRALCVPNLPISYNPTSKELRSDR